MGSLSNHIAIDAPIEKIWRALTDLERLDQFDPAVKKATLISEHPTGLGAKRKVLMQDGKNWFEETITTFQPHQELAYQLTDCSFPIKGLRHTYSFQTRGGQTVVHQAMEYTVKFGVIGVLLDKLMLGKQFDAGVKKFFLGLKAYAEK